MARSVNDANFDDEFGFEVEESSTREEFDLQHYVRIVRKFKFPIVLFTALITGLAAYYAYTATPIYSSSSTLLIESQANSPISFEQLVGVETENVEYYQTQYEILASRGLAQRVVDKLDLWDHPEFSGAPIAPESGLQSSSTNPAAEQPVSDGFLGAFQSFKKLVTGQALINDGAPTTDSSVLLDLNDPASALQRPELTGASAELVNRSNEALELTDEQQIVLGSFMGRLSISPVPKTKLVIISFESPDPVMAATVANAVGEEYINSYLEAQVELTTRASLWLSKRLAELKQVLDESEDRLIAFKQDNGLVDVEGSVGRLNEQELLLVTAELAQARSELSSKEALYREVQALRGDASQLGALPTFQADPLVQGVKIDQGQAQRNLDELRNRYGERHPRVVDAKSQLRTLEVTLEGHVARVVGSVAKDFQLSQQRVASIESKLNAGKTEIQDIGTKRFELEALEREVQTNRTVYDTFFSRITEAKSADGLESANARITDYAVPPLAPVKPKKQLIIALAALASLVLSVLMAFLYEQLDGTVKGSRDIEQRLGINLLGILPMVKGGLFEKSRNLPLNPADIPDKNRTFGEAVNTIRTAISLADGKSPRKVLTITSSIPGEGKSTVAMNLAYSLSQMERVLLIDADMRRPTVAKAVGHDKSIPGLSSLITQTASAKDCIVRGVFDGAFDVLPSGPIPEQPLELLSSMRFEKILAQLGNYYDRIIIDSAPTQAVSDGLILSQRSDAVIYVVKSHETTIDMVKRGLERLKEVKAPLAGVVISQVDIAKITAYGGDYYYQGYYDYYGYHDKDQSSGKRGNPMSGGKLRLSQEELLEIRSDSGEVELDLDYGEQNASTKDEFNLTQRYDSGGKLDLTSANAALSARKKSRVDAIQRRTRIQDDLDIL